MIKYVYGFFCTVIIQLFNYFLASLYSDPQDIKINALGGTIAFLLVAYFVNDFERKSR